MGFRCPACNKDFGIDKKRFLVHVENCGDGIAKSMVGIYTAESEAEAVVNMKIVSDKLKKKIGG